jgi:hypothetical protein
LEANQLKAMGILTPLFKDFFDDHFLSGKGDYQPLNNATEIALAEANAEQEKWRHSWISG